MTGPADDQTEAQTLGKLGPRELESLVLRYGGAPRPEVALSAGVGEDAAALDLRGDLCVLAADPITGAGAGMGRLAVHVAVNDVAATGAEPVALLVTLLVPGDASRTTIQRLMAEIDETASALQVAVVGGHTERTAAVTQPLVSMVAVGRVPAAGLLASGALEAGDRILLTKGAGIEGTAILAHDLAGRLAESVAADLLAAARAMAGDVSIVPEAILARENGARALHDVTEGGVLGALWELAQASGRTLRVARRAIPVAAATAAVCGALGADPLRLIGSGALLIGVAPQKAPAVLAALDAAGIPAAEIGEATGGTGVGQARVQLRDEQPEAGELVLEAPPTDELWRLLANT